MKFEQIEDIVSTLVTALIYDAAVCKDLSTKIPKKQLRATCNNLMYHDVPWIFKDICWYGVRIINVSFFP